MAVLAISNRFSAPPVYQIPSTWATDNIETVHSPDEAGELFGFGYATRQKARSVLRREIFRARPITFHEGYSEAAEIEVSSFLDDPVVDYGQHDEEPIYQHQGPTIGSLQWFDDDCGTFDDYGDGDGEDHTLEGTAPRLRVDTSCQPTNSGKSPLTLVSNFLDTLAGLVHSPSSTPVHRKATKRTSAIMIFDSEVLVGVVAEDVYEPVDEPEPPALSALASPSMDWNFLLPLSTSESTFRIGSTD